MPRFSYIALDARGAEKTGLLEATDLQEVANLLRGQGLFPTVVSDASSNKMSAARSSRSLSSVPQPASAQRRFSFGRGIGSRELTAFTRQLATLLRSGMPLLRSLEVLARQERNPSFRPVIESLGETIRSGGALSEGMARHPRLFDRLYVSMVRAGEAGGVLDVIFERLARFQEKSLQLRGKITAALLYPLIVLAVAVAILAGLLVFVVPKFKQIFADLLKGAPLPPLTQLVLTVSEAVKAHFLLTAGLLIVFGCALRAIRRTAAGARLFDTLILRLPLFGPLFLRATVARFGRTLGTLLSSGVPILPALLIARDACGNRRIAAAISSVHDRVKEGAAVARPLEESEVFPPMVTSMIDVGEQTGQLPSMLGKIAEIYEEEVDNAVAGLSTLIEPLLILFLAVVVGTIVIALFLPIVRIVQLLT
jgi:type IV pilus assembly protein PilC